MKTYIISPSELSYVCDYCTYLGKNYNLYPGRISAGILQTLDGIEKNHFLGDVKKINNSIKAGEVIDPYNITFYSKILKDNKNRPFRIKGKGDAIIIFKDKTYGIIDYKTSKFKQRDGKDYDKELKEKIKEYIPQLHCYSLLYSNLETDEKFLAEKSMAKTTETIATSVQNKIKKIRKISIKDISLLGLVFIYPEEALKTNNITVKFTHQFEEVKFDIKNFMKFLTKYLDMLHSKNFPEPTYNCGTCNYIFEVDRLINKK
jgi:hypothetical protein